MAKKYLDDIGLSYFFDKLKLLFATKDTATQSADGLMSSSDKTKLDGLDQLVESASGESVTIEDGSGIESIVVYGKSHQGSTPTPGSPIAIEVVKGEINLLDVFNKFPKATTTYQGCTITSNEDGTFTLSGTNTVNYNFNFNSTAGSLTIPPGTYTLSDGGELSGCKSWLRVGDSTYDFQINGQPRSITLESETTITQWGVTVFGSATVSGTCKPMVEQGTTHGDFVSYNSFNLQVDDLLSRIDTHGNVLASLPNGTKDILTVDSVGHVVLEKRTKSLTITNTSGWVKSGSASNGFYKTLAALSPGLKGGTKNGVVCSIATAVDSTSTYFQTTNSVYIDGSFNVNLDSAVVGTTVSSFSSWLANNPFDVILELATPQTIDLGYIDIPDIQNDNEVSISALLTPTIDVSWWTRYAEPIAKVIDSIKNLVI